MDNMRQEFEAWAKTTSLKNFLFWHPSDNQYEVHAVQTAFDGWQASRAALCVELPKGVDLAKDTCGIRELVAFDFAISVVATRLEESGVSYK